MFFFLTEATKQLIVRELRGYWATHPRYRDLVDNIQGKYSFDQRPQYGIVVRTGSANKVQLSADHFMGTGQSYVALAGVAGFPNTSVEWVREDSLAIQANGGRFPSPAGVYYCELTEEDQMMVDPLLEIRAEPLTRVNDCEFLLSSTPWERSLRLYEMPSGRGLRAPADYTCTGTTIYLREAVGATGYLLADYRYPGPSSGPWPVAPLKGYPRPIPGAVLVFGRRMQKGDRWVVVVEATREDAFLQYGGRWDLSVDVDVIARDPAAQMEIADQTAMFLWTSFRSKVVDWGVDVQDVNLGGESEEVYDETGDDYFYNASLQIQLQTDWSLYQPLIPRIAQVTASLRTQLPPELEPVPYRDPWFFTRYSYEVIS
jgi:hypothetical protein